LCWSQAMNRSLIPVTNRPLNAETPLSVLEEPVTPIDLFYVRDHCDIPTLRTESFRVRVEGERTLALWLAELMALPATTVRSAMACAGNGRIFMEPKPAGTPWELGAISMAEWTGTPLIEVL